MNVLDLLVFITIVAFAVRGYRKGAVRESLELASAVGGLLIAYRISPEAGAWVSAYSGIPASVTVPVLFVVMALLVASIGFGLAGAIHRVVGRRLLWRRTDLGFGIALGTVKGLVVCGIVLVLLAQLSVPMVISALENSAAGRSMFRVMPDVYRYIDVLLERSG